MEAPLKSMPEKPWYTSAILSIFEDASCALGISPSAFARDVHTIEHRLSAEGESFLTKTLPSFGKSIDLALQGATPLATPLFKKRRRRAALPAFLQALTKRVFTDDGWVRSNPCLPSIALLRQLCYWCKKLEKGYSDESLQKATQEFVDIDNSLAGCSNDYRAAEPLLAVARAVVWWVFRDIGPCHHHNPSHGPGAVASGANCVEKRALSVSYTDVERVFRPIPWFRSLRDSSEDIGTVLNREKKPYGLSRTEFVPKDSSGPRTIGLEPPEYMWVQQAVKAWMYEHIEQRSIAKGQVNFTNQSVNRELARNWSDFETLDMSKASDRNSYVLVKTLFEGTRLWPYLDASRTPGTVLPDGTTLFYRKFAPMGSAVCFPVQACVYYALAVAALHLAGMPILLAYRKVYVYGDDLVVPHGSFSTLRPAFEAVGLKFNPDKCCTNGRFRESCGLDAYDGCDVTPVRLRMAYPQRPSDVLRLVEHSNALYEAGYRVASATFRTLALRQFSELKKLGLPQTHRSDLPIACWRCAPEEETVRYRTRNSITSIKGWVVAVDKVTSDDVYEVRHVRESLARYGPIGNVQHVQNGSVRMVRTLDKRYSGGLRKRSFVVIRE